MKNKIKDLEEKTRSYEAKFAKRLEKENHKRRQLGLPNFDFNPDIHRHMLFKDSFNEMLFKFNRCDFLINIILIDNKKE